jgi:hypothetical protein
MSACDRTRRPQPDPKHVAALRTASNDGTRPRPATDPLAALERARRLAFEAQEAERWDGLG